MTARGTTSAAGLILFHGAGGDRDHPTFLALEAELDVPVDRINFPYRQKGPGRRPPDRMPKLIAAVNEAVEAAATRWGVDPGAIVLGGRSMGGRAASMAIAEGQAAAGLVLLSYPLHPPGKPEKLRVEHLDQVTCPTLLIQGRRDPFGKPEEFAEHLPLLAGPLTEHWIDANHSPSGYDDEIVGWVGAWLAGLGSLGLNASSS
ncbi:MAG: alpha/beta family hydrolase [Actinomycetota bacterium]